MPKQDDRGESEMSRRDFLKTAGAGAAALGLTGGLPSAAEATSSEAARTGSGASGGPYNILFIMSDQETEMRSFPRGYRLPGRERLRRMGVSFDNHQICACVCTPSRSVMLTGQHIQNTGMFDNTSLPWGQSLSPDIPTIGHMLREAGYHTAYQGKWHLSVELEEFSHDPGEVPQLTGREIFEAHGFSDYIGVGDIIGHTRGGYDNDGFISEISQRWLRTKGKPLNEKGTPWFLAVGFVNPHDVMYYNTDRSGEKVQDQDYVMMDIKGDPSHAIYEQKWEVELPATRKQPLDEPGRPRAHWEQSTTIAGMLGTIPNEDRRWRDLNNYYLNCIQDNDRHLEALLDELAALGMLDNTIIIFTSDHGDLAGAHAMWGKGATAYREQNNVPFIIAHPEFQGGRTCRAVTSHADLVPTMVGLSGASPEKKAALTKELPGKDVTGVLGSPEQAPLNAVREGALYNFAMLTALDGGFMFEAAKALHAGGPEEVARRGIQPDVKKRGHIRTVFDGRYKFSRYFSPLEHNRPTTMEELTHLNDLELYDVESDPLEAKNLAADPRKNGELVMAMNAKLNALIDEEVGEDDGSFIPWDNIKSLLVTEPDP